MSTSVPILPNTVAKPQFKDVIYKPFFLMAMLVMLTAGAAWGVMLLLKIGESASFTGVNILEVNAHGHAQIMGWVGLFIMGFSYQAFPRIWHGEIRFARLALIVLAAMVAGMVLRTTAMYEHDHPWALTVHTLGAVMEMTAVVLFTWQMWATFKQSGQKFDAYLGFVFSAMFFLVIQTFYGSWHMDRLMHELSYDQRVAQISGWQSPLRDMQIHGMALLMIMGVGIRVFPANFKLPAISPRRAWTGLGLLLTAVLLEISIFIAMTLTGNHMVGALLLLPWLMLPAGAGLIIWPWKLWRPMPVSDRSAKFIRAAFAWLFISLGMLLLLPAYVLLHGQTFSHAYYGSARHAITVGFISMMIVGMSSRIVPKLRGISPLLLPALWLPMVLINLGCFLRVTLQVATDWHPVFFKLTGISGCLEWLGFTFWAAHMVAVMFGLGRYRQTDSPLVLTP